VTRCALILAFWLVWASPGLAMTTFEGLSPQTVRALEKIRTETELQISELSAAEDRGQAWGRLGMYYHAQHLPWLAEEVYGRAISEHRDARWHYLRAVAAGDRGELTQALSDYAAAVELAPGYAPAWYRLGMGRLVQGDVRGARQALSEARRLAPDAAIVLMGLADVESAGADWDQALKLLKRAHGLAPEAGQVAYKLAMVYRRLGDLDQAKAWLDRRAGNNATPEIDDPLLLEVAELSQSGRFYVKAGEWALERGDVGQAVIAFGNATELAPSDVAAGVGYAVALVLQDEDLPARVEARRLLAIAPGSPRVWYTLAWVLRHSVSPEELEEAATAVRRSLELAEDPRTRMLAGALAMKRQQFNNAKQDFATLAAADPEQPYYRFWHGMALLADGDCSGRTHVSEAVQRRPTWGEAHIVLARAEALCGAPAAGLKRATALQNARDDVDTRLTLAMALITTDAARAHSLATVELPHPDAKMLADYLAAADQPLRIFWPGSEWWLPAEVSRRSTSSTP
jgi:tetratricopeptide (TPR) repeat protein